MADIDGILSFAAVCSLLDELEALLNVYRAPKSKLKKRDFKARQRQIVERWATVYNFSILKDNLSVLAVLSLLFPALRCDRVYTMKEHVLSRVVTKVLGMGVEALEKLRKNWRLQDKDFGTAVEKIMRGRCIEKDVDDLLAVDVEKNLDQLSQRVSNDIRAEAIMCRTLEKCNPSQAKWLIRIILKSFAYDLVPRYVTFLAIHPGIPRLWSMNADLRIVSELCLSPDSSEVGPRTGIPIHIPSCGKGHGCRHVCTVAARTADSCYVETKYDGQRMQIHVDLSLPEGQQIVIFSKNRKDSTKDRWEIIKTIRKALKIGCSDQRFRVKCVVEAELVLWNNNTKRVEEYNKTANYLRSEGTGKRLSDVNLMAVFFDALLVDEHSLVHHAYVNRTRVLSELIRVEQGQSILPNRFHLNLRPLESAINALQCAMSHAITLREEGFVVKPANAPYTGRHGWMKLKKDHIPGLGDNLDFCIVGAGFDADYARDGGKAQQGQKWNTWHVGCLENKSDVLEDNARPHFSVLFTVEYNLTKAEAMFLSCRTLELSTSPSPREKVDVGNFDVTIASGGVKPMDAVLPNPILVELVGAGFDIPWGQEYILRWPRLVKIYQDREWIDGVTMEELRDAAKKALAVGNEEEKEQWNLALGVVDRYHGANGTVIPSSRVWGKAREEQFRQQDQEYHGIRMMYGLDIEAILEKRGATAVEKCDTAVDQIEMKRKIIEIPETPQKRVCLSVKSPVSTNRPFVSMNGHTRPVGNKITHHDIHELFLSARIVAITKIRRTEITTLLPSVFYLEISELDANKENVLATCQHIPQDQIVLVDGHHAEIVRKVLGLVKEASLIGGKWSVYNWKIVQCIKGDIKVDWRDEHLFTYVGGFVSAI